MGNLPVSPYKCGADCTIENTTPIPYGTYVRPDSVINDEAPGIFRIFTFKKVGLPPNHTIRFHDRDAKNYKDAYKIINSEENYINLDIDDKYEQLSVWRTGNESALEGGRLSTDLPPFYHVDFYTREPTDGFRQNPLQINPVSELDTKSHIITYYDDTFEMPTGSYTDIIIKRNSTEYGDISGNIIVIPKNTDVIKQSNGKIIANFGEHNYTTLTKTFQVLNPCRVIIFNKYNFTGAGIGFKANKKFDTFTIPDSIECKSFIVEPF